ncbi:MAG: hypothetical protein JXQ75_13575, partial [Phycisphaerae bacterium]|nr:hypothetical protein [Phycisphaerae bacterium]
LVRESFLPLVRESFLPLVRESFLPLVRESLLALARGQEPRASARAAFQAARRHEPRLWHRADENPGLV